MSIDWSKAPEGCLEIGKNQWDELAWLCADGYIYLHCNGCMVNWKTPRALKRSDFHVFDIRPEDDWTGEGLPPVGTVCEYQTTSWPADQWEVRAVCYISDYHVVTAEKDGTERSVCADIARFRPIRTPEQIAAEERDKAVADMHKLFYSVNDTGKEAMFRLYDAGYRKQVAP